MSEAAWNKAFTQGSKSMQDRLRKVHAKNPKFQSWLQKSGHGAGVSVKQASKEVKASARAKKLAQQSLKAYGATKGQRMGGEDGSGETLRDTIAPLTRDQHSKVQAAQRAAKAAAKPAKPAAPKKPLTKDQRLAAIAAAARKAKAKHDVPTMDVDDDHDDLRDLHQSLHIRRGYNEEMEKIDEIRIAGVLAAMDKADKARLAAQEKEPPFTPDKNPVRRGRGGSMSQAKWLAKQAMMKKVKEMGMKEEVEQTDEALRIKDTSGSLGNLEKAKPGASPSAQRFAQHTRNIVAKDIKKIRKDTEPFARKQALSYADYAVVKEVADEPKHGDAGEYDYEGDMAKSQLRSIMTNAKRMHDMLEDNTNLPEWVQSKITLAEDYVLTATNYMESEMNEEVEQVAEEAEQVDEKYMGFKKLATSIKEKGGARDPEAVAAAIGRKKYGKEKFQAAAAAGKKMSEALDPVGKEDKDIDNDGDSDKTDVYLSTKRKAIGKAIKDRLAKKLGK
jgi:hypothetical protein